MKTKSKGVRRTISEQALEEAVVDGGLVGTSLDPIGFALSGCPNDGTLVDTFIGVVDVPTTVSDNLMIHGPEVRTVMDVDAYHTIHQWTSRTSLAAERFAGVFSVSSDHINDTRRLAVAVTHGLARTAAIMASTYKAYLGVGVGPLSNTTVAFFKHKFGVRLFKLIIKKFLSRVLQFVLPELGAKMIGALWKDEVQSDDVIGIHKASYVFLILLKLKVMMKNLLLERDLLRVKNVTLPKGTYVKLQPYTSDFLNTSDSKAMYRCRRKVGTYIMDVVVYRKWHFLSPVVANMRMYSLTVTCYIYLTHYSTLLK
ncbi:hypothetical protein CTI12_AA119890 [Artemisia annua]|uniref:Uncharacterized protein n=1 Tax=Artemisia annua TaxID=35608 RepID=A0A2U1PRP0_ARTAN|nr:hypothetical protein CTI12_AA119890 [Artemisia annua]